MDNVTINNATITVNKANLTLTVGDNGYYLTYQGHYLKIDGKYNPCTVRSIKEFQHDKGFKVNGKVDEMTAKKLKIIYNKDFTPYFLFFFLNI